MPAFDALQPASFDGIKFAVRSVSIKGGVRDHVHEFPHSPGGLPETLGRKLYTVEMEAIFSTESFRDYPDAWPGDLSDLRDRFEQEVRSTLVVPTIGDIQAYAVDWDQQWTVANQSGESARFTFREDATAALLADNVVNINYQAIGAKNFLLKTTADELGLGDLFGSIEDFCNSIQALGDKAELMGDLYASKVTGLASECNALIERADELQQPRNHTALFAVIDLGVAAIRLHEDLLSKLTPTFLFPVPSDMSLLAVSRAMYGDTSRVMELLRMNAVADFDLVPGGTLIRGYVNKAA